MGRKTFGPDHAEMAFAVWAHIHFVLWHGRLTEFRVGSQFWLGSVGFLRRFIDCTYRRELAVGAFQKPM